MKTTASAPAKAALLRERLVVCDRRAHAKASLETTRQNTSDGTTQGSEAAFVAKHLGLRKGVQEAQVKPETFGTLVQEDSRGREI